MDEFDLDRAAEVGWAGFLTRLAGHLATMTEPLRITPYGADDTDAAPYPVLLVEPADDLLQAQLFPPGGVPWPEDSRRERMVGLGWSEELGGAAYRLRMPRAHAHLMAAALTDTLRDVAGAPHPAFLDAGALTISAPAGPDQAEAPVPELDLDEAIKVTTPVELREAVETSLHVVMGHPPRRDADGDIPIVFGTTLVYVRTADSQPVVTIFAVVVQDIADLGAARREVGILNRQSVFAKFHLVGNQVIASVAIPSLPFVPRHLVGMVEMMGKELDQLDDALALRVSGRRWIDIMTGVEAPGEPAADPVNPPYEGDDAGQQGSRPDGGDDGAGPGRGPGRGTRDVDGDDDVDGSPQVDGTPLPDELVTLHQFHVDDDAPLDPAVVADVCHRDRSLVLQLIRAAEEQTLSWRRTLDEARAAGATDAARDATDELKTWNMTARDLRAALRHIVTFGGGDEGSTG